MFRWVLVLLLVFLLLPIPANAMPETVTVSLFEAHPGLRKLSIQAPLELVGMRKLSVPTGIFTVRTSQNLIEITDQKLRKIAAPAAMFRVRSGLPQGFAITLPGGERRRYKGTIEFKAGRNGAIQVSNTVRSIDYVTAVVGSETLPDWPVEMLKAQAVVTQTRLFRHKKTDYLGDSTAREAYLGAGYERPAARRAVRAAWGKLLLYKGTPAMPLYHSTCAGGTSDGARYFGMNHDPIEYLCGVSCSNCSRSPFFRTLEKSIPYTQFAKTFPKGVPTVASSDERRRPLTLRFADSTQVSAYQFWLNLGQNFGWDKAPGTRFALQKKGDVVIVNSTGAGHGVGMCQWGAAELARQGKSFAQILNYYYPNTSIGKQ